MTPVQGKDVSLYVYRDVLGIPTPIIIACASSCRMTLHTNLISVMTADSGIEEDYEPGSEDMDLSIDGVVTLDELPRFQFRDFIKSTRTRQRILLVYTNDYGDRYALDMYVLFPEINNEDSADDFATFSVSMKRCGSMTETYFLNCIKDSDGNPVLDSDGEPIR